MAVRVEDSRFIQDDGLTCCCHGVRSRQVAQGLQSSSCKNEGGKLGRYREIADLSRGGEDALLNGRGAVVSGAAGDEKGASAGFQDVPGRNAWGNRIFVCDVARDGDGLVRGGVEGGGVDAVLGAEVEIGEDQVAGGGIERAVPIDRDRAVHGLGGCGVVREVAAEGDGVVRNRVGLGTGEEGDRAGGAAGGGIHSVVRGVAEEDVGSGGGDGADLPVRASGPGAVGVTCPGGVHAGGAGEDHLRVISTKVADEAGDIRRGVG